MSEYTEAVAHSLEGLHAAPGACAGCHSCGLDTRPCETCNATGYADGLTYATGTSGDECPTCDGCGRVEVQEGGEADPDEQQAADEGGFSWSSCDCCGSNLGGDRYPAHTWRSDQPLTSAGSLIHLDICTDCLLFLANGDEPEGWPYR